MHWSEKFGAQPKQSWRRFLIGLGLFWVFALALILALESLLNWQFYLLCTLLMGCFAFAVWGYLGILANRIYRLRVHQDEYIRVTSKQE